MFIRHLPALPPAPESTRPALAASATRHRLATPNHRRVIRRADDLLKVFDAYQAEADFIARNGR